MKTIILTLFLLISNQCYSEIGNDKIAHFGVSAGLTTAMYFTMSAFTGREQELKLPALIGASVFAFGLGLGMEVIDAGDRPLGQRYLDGGDLAANALGVATSALLLYLLDARTIMVHPRGVAFRF